MFTIASALPGRIRLRLTDPAESLQSLVSSCQKLEAVTSVRPNMAARSLVLTFDAAVCDVSTMLARLASFAPVPAKASDALPASILQRKRPRPLKLQINRIAKLGALSSLAASLAWAASGNKRLHTVSGVVFLGFLAVHLTVYRRNLTR